MITSKYNLIKENEVIIVEEHRFTQDWGNYSVLWIWNTSAKTLRSETINGNSPYHLCDFTDMIDNNLEYLKAAAENYRLHFKDIQRSNYVGNNEPTYIGCEVILKRARKAPNKIPLTVINFYQGGWDGRYYQSSEAALKDAGTSCIIEVIKGASPYWQSLEKL